MTMLMSISDFLFFLWLSLLFLPKTGPIIAEEGMPHPDLHVIWRASYAQDANRHFYHSEFDDSHKMILSLTHYTLDKTF